MLRVSGLDLRPATFRGVLALGIVGVMLLGGIATSPIGRSTPAAAVPVRGAPAFHPVASAIPRGGPSPESRTPAIDVSSTGSVNWPTYMGSDSHTSTNPLERTINPSNVSLLAPVWNTTTNGSAFSSPIVVNGTVYWGEWNGYEYAASAANGSLLWSDYLGFDPDCYAGGIESTPAYSNGTLYLGAPNGTWDALNASTGALDWSLPLGGALDDGYYNWASGLVYRHSLYVGLASCDDEPLVPGEVEQVNLTGPPSVNHTWQAVSGGLLGSTVWTTPTADAGANTIWVTTGNDEGAYQPYAQSIIALNATTMAVRGSWEVPNVIGIDSDFGSTAVLVTPAHGAPLVVASNKNGETYAWNRSNVSTSGWGPAWADDTGGGWSGAAFNGTTVFVAGGSVDNNTTTVYALAPETGAIDWQTTLPAPRFPFASVDSADGLLFVGAGNGEFALDGANGTILWNATVPSGEVVYGEAVVADGHLYVPSGSTNGATGRLTAYAIPFDATASVSTPNASTPWEATFSAAATGGMTPYSFVWAFDDGAVVSEPSVDHLFEYAGSHWGHLVVTDPADDVAVFNLSVVTTAAAPPFSTAISASASLGETPFTVLFRANEQNGSGPPYEYDWNFGDGTTGTGDPVAHTFESAGVFGVRLEQTGPLGETSNASSTVQTVAPLAGTLLASPSTGTVPLTVEFTLAAANGSAPYTIGWSFGDGGTRVSGTTVKHTYTTVGNFTAGANVTDSLTGRLTLTTEISTFPPPFVLTVNWSSNLLGCHPFQESVAFTANDSGGTPPVGNSWSFGDGSATVTGNPVAHTYTTAGRFLVNLTATEANGTQATTQVPVSVVPPPCTTVSPSSGTGGLALELLVGGVVAIAAVAVAVTLYRRRRSEGPGSPPTPPAP
ncbi:MAG: PKD domain-containing protein [Thermoplasmata archaeon]|nr:PKD domain-containing protein [Thermoplasmata archaeon]